MSSIQVTGSFSYELNDVISAYFAYRKTRPYYGLLKMSAIVLVIATLLTLLSFLPIFIIFLAAEASTKNYAFEVLDTTGGLFMLVLLLLLLLPGIRLYEPLTRLRIKREYEKNKSTYASEYQLVADKDGLSVNIPNWSSMLGWSRVEKVHEYKEGFLVIYKNGSEYLPIPRRAFKQNTDLEEFRELVSQVVGKKIMRV